MISNLKIRESRPSDVAGIEQVYVDAFPDEDLLPLVRELLDLKQSVISLVGMRENVIVGHISFTFATSREGKIRSRYWLRSRSRQLCINRGSEARWFRPVLSTWKTQILVMSLFSVTRPITVVLDLRQRTKSLHHIHCRRNGVEHGSLSNCAMQKCFMGEDCLCRNHGVKLHCGLLE